MKAFSSRTTKEEQEMKMLRLYSTRDMELCPLDKWGILDPGEYRRDIADDQRERIRREDGKSSQAKESSRVNRTL